MKPFFLMFNFQNHNLMQRFSFFFFALAALFFMANPQAQAQNQKADTLFLSFGDGSQIRVLVKSKRDRKTLENMDVNKVIQDALAELDGDIPNGGTVKAYDWGNLKIERVETADDKKTNISLTLGDDDNVELSEDNSSDDECQSNRFRVVSNEWGLSFGLNNYLQNGKIPSDQQYGLRPWGSRYVDINSMLHIRTGRNSPVHFWVGLDVRWMNFMFSEETRVRKTESEVEFYQSPDDLKKSKLTAFYIGAPIKMRYYFAKPNGSAPFIGIGGYGAYRLDSYESRVFFEDGDKRRKRERSDFYLEDVRYGVQVELGWGERGDDFCLFGQMDLNPLFKEGHGPELVPFTLGVRF